jgi:hypothetical protein
MALGQYTKTPGERKRYSVDYYDWLDQGERIFGVTFETYVTDGFEVDAFQIDPDGTRVIFFVSGGLDDTAYTVNVKMTTTGGQVKEDEILFVIEAIDDDDLVIAPI